MAGLDGVTNRNVSYSSDSRRVPATVSRRVPRNRPWGVDAGRVPHGWRVPFSGQRVCLCPVTPARGRQSPPKSDPPHARKIGLPRARRDRYDGCRERLARNVRALRILWVDPRRGHSKAPAGWTFAKQQQAVTMSRPTKTLVHDGEEWLAMLTGGDTSRQEYSIGVLFFAKATDREAFGRLRGIPPERFDHATADQLRAALVTALSGDED